jgi:hypothetical protein
VALPFLLSTLAIRSPVNLHTFSGYNGDDDDIELDFTPQNGVDEGLDDEPDHSGKENDR